MRFIKLLLSVFLLMPLAAQISFAQNKDEIAAVDNFISAQAKEKKVKEYKYARKILRADVNADDREDLVVLYMLDGFKTGIGYVRYLAVFVKRGEDFQYADSQSVSGIIEQSIELESVKNGTIRLETLEYFKKGDTHYRKIGVINFIFSDGKLKEI